MQRLFVCIALIKPAYHFYKILIAYFLCNMVKEKWSFAVNNGIIGVCGYFDYRGIFAGILYFLIFVPVFLNILSVKLFAKIVPYKHECHKLIPVFFDKIGARLSIWEW